MSLVIVLYRMGDSNPRIRNYYSNNDYYAVYEAFDLCERIGDEIIRKMNLDKYEVSCMVVKDFRLDDVLLPWIEADGIHFIGYQPACAGVLMGGCPP